MRGCVVASKPLRAIFLRLASVVTSVTSVAIGATPAMSDGADQPFVARVPSLGEVTVKYCGLAKSHSYAPDHIIVTKFDNNSVSYPFEAIAIVIYPGKFAETSFPGGSPTYWEQTRRAKKVDIKLTMPDGKFILASEQSPTGRLGYLEIDDPNRRVTQLSFSYRFTVSGMPTSFYRFDFFIDEVQICGGTLNGPIWKGDAAQLPAPP